MRRVVDERQEVDERDQLAVVQPRADKAGVVVPPLFAVALMLLPAASEPPPELIEATEEAATLCASLGGTPAILDGYRPEALDEDKQRELRRIVAAADAELRD